MASRSKLESTRIAVWGELARMRRIAPGPPTRRLEAVDARHRDVEDDDVGVRLGDAAGGALPVAGLPHDLEVGLLLERDADEVAHLGHVVAEEDADAPAAGPLAGREH